MKTPALLILALSVLTTPAFSQWKAAVTQADITPTEPMYLSGFASRVVIAEGTGMPLRAKTLAIEDAKGVRLVMVTLDLVEVPHQLRSDVAARVQAEFHLPNESLLINCSHTHCGPELKYEDIEFEDLTDPLRKDRCLRYNATLTDHITRIIGEALNHLEPATLSYGHARCGFAMNRRLKNDKAVGEPYLNSPNPDGPVDHDVPVLTVERPNKSLMGLVFGYACHNTTLSIKLWHADYAGHAQKAIEEAHPGTVALFMMGCGGDQNGYPRSAEAFSGKHGQSLATAVEAAITAKMRPLSGTLRLAYESVRLDYQPPPSKAELQQRLAIPKGTDPTYSIYMRDWDRRRLAAMEKGTLRDHYDYPVQIIRIGDDLTWVGLSGETCVDYSLRLKHELAGKGAVWISGYCNDVLAYIPSKRVLLEGGYEAKSSIVYWSNPLHPNYFAESLEERIIGKVHEMLK